MQRLKAIEQATKDGHWGVAQHLELAGAADVGLATDAEVRGVVCGQVADAKLKEAREQAKKACWQE